MTDLRKDLASEFEVIDGQVQPQPRGHLTRFSARRLAELRERDQAQYRMPARQPDPIDWGNVAAWLIVVLLAIGGGMLIDSREGGLPLASCANTTVAQQETKP
jgi:hypothetical protein